MGRPLLLERLAVAAFVRPSLKLRSFRLCLIVALSACGDDAAERAAPVAPVAPPEPTLVAQSFRLDNGLEVELVEGPCDGSVAVAMLFDVGMDHDPADRSGMAHVVERLLSAPDAAAGTERVVEVGNAYTAYSVVVPADRVPAELDAIAARITSPAFTEEGLAAARTAALEELANRRGGDPALTALSYATESVQPTRGHGWRRGIASEVEAITLADVDAFYRASFAAGNARLIVAGHFDAAAIRTRIETAFGPLPAGTPAAVREPTVATVTGTLVFGDAPTAVAIAVPAPLPSDPLYPAFLVLATRLVSTPSEARTWQARYDPLAAPETLFLTGAIVPGEPAEPAATRVRSEMTQLLSQPLTPDDITAVRARYGFFLGTDPLDPAACSLDARAFALARARRAELGLDALGISDALERVTDAQRGDATAIFGPARIAAVVAGGTIR